MNYTDFSEDERKFYLSESGFDSREKEFFRLRVYEEKTLFETAEIMGYSPRTIDRMSNSFISSDDFQNNMSGGHPLAVGYSRMAVAIKELIEKALLNSYFSDYTGDV